MKWFSFRRRPHPTDDAVAARRRAEAALERAREEAPTYRALARSLREAQQRNHLAEAFEHALRGRR